MRNTVPGWRLWRAWSFLFALPSIPRAEALSSKGFFFTGEGVGVVIRSVGVNDLVKTAFWLGCLRLYLLQSSDTRLSESQAEAEELNQSQSLGTCVIGLFFPFSLGLRQSGLHWIVSARIIRGVGRKWKRSDSSDSDSVILMTLNTTGIFDFHKVMSALTTSLTIPTPTPTPCLVKTSVKPECPPINLTKLPGTGTLTAIARRTAHYLRYSMLIHHYPGYHTIPFSITSHLVSSLAL